MKYGWDENFEFFCRGSCAERIPPRSPQDARLAADEVERLREKFPQVPDSVLRKLIEPNYILRSREYLRQRAHDPLRSRATRCISCGESLTPANGTICLECQALRCSCGRCLCRTQWAMAPKENADGKTDSTAAPKK